MTDSKYTNFDYQLSKKILTMLKPPLKVNTWNHQMVSVSSYNFGVLLHFFEYVSLPYALRQSAEIDDETKDIFLNES
ncbi:putative tyrosine-protein phosphatase non-receptor type 9-like protein [Operophtera brumata]|uniref:Putative tyrosine-protein phosphatase non-receptor type 9-like protein n=1 Tax=Operophtera brumata TaxID=104452 RepID=A0A0L7LSV8_OPEBR|nr:putative tyrosine-protein phosphatase non-receptor type 9-like protein [Operophtera brumata]